MLSDPLSLFSRGKLRVGARRRGGVIIVAGKYQNSGDQRESQKCCGALPGTHSPLLIHKVYTTRRVKISVFDFAGANGFNQNAPAKDQEFSVCEAGGVAGRAPAKAAGANAATSAR